MRLACVGDNVVDVYTSLGLMFPGGNAVNVAVAARRAGVEASYLGVLGSDAAGRAVLRSLREEGVSLERLRVRDGPNAYCTVEIVDGDRRFLVSDLGVSRFVLDADDLSFLATNDLVHTGDTSHLDDQIRDVAERVPVSFDFAEQPEEYWSRLVDCVSIATFSATQLSDKEASDFARRVVDLGPRIVLVTLGERGALALDSEGAHFSRSSVSPVDTLGAGDSLIGTFLAGVLLNNGIGDSLDRGSDRAAATCLHHGAFGHGFPIEGIPTTTTEMSSPPAVEALG
jgi:sugar/nucleoside kinase (ribokinase family)